MTRRRDTYRIVSRNEIMTRAENFIDDGALKHCHAIEAAGGKPEIRYSELSGYYVVDLLGGPPPWEK